MGNLSESQNFIAELGFPIFVGTILLVTILAVLVYFIKEQVRNHKENAIKLSNLDGRLTNIVELSHELKRSLDGLRSDLREVLVELMRRDGNFKALLKFLEIDQPGNYHGDD
jgi:hypothetical protein